MPAIQWGANFSVVDSATPTGIRVQLPAAGMPATVDGERMNPTEWNRNDGFSPNTPLLTHIADLDPVASHLPGWNAIGASLDPTSPIVLVDIATGDRIPLWAELDAHAASDTDRLLTIRPAISLPEGHTFAVGLRSLVDHAGAPIAPSDAFRAFRDRGGKALRLPLKPGVQDIIGVNITKVTIPVAAGRNLAVLVEAAVRNRVLQLRGIDSTHDFIERQSQHMSDDGN